MPLDPRSQPSALYASLNGLLRCGGLGPLPLTFKLSLIKDSSGPKVHLQHLLSEPSGVVSGGNELAR